MNVRKKQRAYYSGKKRKHTLKAQVVVNQATGQVICTAFKKGRVHDFRLLKQHRIPMLPQQLCLADRGYQGLANLHPYSCTPLKKPKKAKLGKGEREYNQMLTSLRIVAEHTNRRLKVWQILFERYRNRRQRFGLRFNLIAADSLRESRRHRQQRTRTGFMIHARSLLKSALKQFASVQYREAAAHRTSESTRG